MIKGIALGRVTVWNNCPLRTEKGTGCPDLQRSSWAQCGLLAMNHRCFKQASKQGKKTPNHQVKDASLQKTILHFEEKEFQVLLVRYL